MLDERDGGGERMRHGFKKFEGGYSGQSCEGGDVGWCEGEVGDKAEVNFYGFMRSVTRGCATR